MAERPLAVHVRWDYLTGELFTESHHQRLEAMCEVRSREPVTDLSADGLVDLLAEVEILVTGWGAPTLTPETLALMPRLRYITHAAGTVKDMVGDGETPGGVWDRGIRVSSAAAANATPVAEFTVAAILFANKAVFRLQQRYRENRQWERPIDAAPGLGNLHKTIGLIGASRVGRKVIELLAPYDMAVLVHDPFLSADEATRLGVQLVSLDDLLSRSDVVSLHAPSVPATQGMLNRERLALMRDGATFINTARGALVDQDALTDELGSGRIDAVIDVTVPEVLPADSPLYELPNVLLTPHIAGAAAHETTRMTDLALDELERFLAGAPLQHEVVRSEFDTLA